jgi:hypothetical protein
MTYVPKVGDHVTATWTTKSGRTKSVTATVQTVTAKRAQLRYETSSSGGRSFSWAVREPWFKHEQLRPSAEAPKTLLPVVNALVGVERDRLVERCGESYCLCSGGKNVACKAGKAKDQGSRELLESFSRG